MRCVNPYTRSELTPRAAPAEVAAPCQVHPPRRVWRITGTQFLHKRRIEAANKSEARAIFKVMLGLTPRDRLPAGHDVLSV